MLQEFFHPIIIYLHHNPHSAGIISFFIVFSEAMAVIGTVFPGSITMSAIGVLIGSGVIPGVSTIAWAVAGAICGDTISYLVGYWYKGSLHRVWPFRTHPQWLAKGEKFVHRHGGKSIIIGRFFGPMRSMVPLIAGMLRMRPIRFLLAAVPSASVWAIAYLTPGILIGALSLELPPGIAFEFIAITLVILAALLLCIWMMRFSIRHFANKIDRDTRKTWDFLRTHKTSHWITRLLTDPQHPENHRQLILSVYAIGTACLLLIAMISAFSHGVFTWLNSPIYHLLRNLRVTCVDNVMLAITILASPPVMLTSAVLIAAWFAINRRWRAAIHWLGAVFLSAGSAWILKHILFSPRPNQLFHAIHTSSFPSGHTVLAVTIFGMLALFVAQEIDKEYRKSIYTTASFMFFAVAFSRIFLGAHWLTDVIGSILLGLTSIMLVNISYHRGTIPRLGPKRTLTASLAIIVVVWLIVGIHSFSSYKRDYALYWRPHTISYQQLRQHKLTKIFPLYRENRLGHPKEAFNVEWLAELPHIRTSLAKQGWILHPPCMSLKGLLYRFSTTGTNRKLSLLPQLYQNRCPALLMTKQFSNKKQGIILQLWKSNIKVRGHKNPLWVGVIKYHHAPYKLLTAKKPYNIRRFFFGATKELVPYLTKYQWHEFVYSREEQPKVMRKLHWNGKILLVY